MARYHLEVSALARHDIREAYAWYESSSSEAARRFKVAIELGLAEIQSNPERWSIFDVAARRYRIDPFPYFLVYLIDKFVVDVIACQHAHRLPDYWQRRFRPER